METPNSSAPVNPSTQPPAPTQDYPGYWLGQIKIISQMERRGVLTRSEMINQVHEVVKQFESHEKTIHWRAVQMAKK